MDESTYSFPRRFWGHLKTITTHRHLVMRLCFKMGLYRQGLLHDLSKYSPVEFTAGVRYWQGGKRSPIEKEKEVLGFSYGWQHHKGHNPHHWEYWIDRDRSLTGLRCLRIPENYLKEMVCDRIAACMVYQGSAYTDASAYDYLKASADMLMINKESLEQLLEYLLWVKEYGLDEAFKKIRNHHPYQ